MLTTLKYPGKKIAGFTLIELMVTVVIIGILAAIALPNYRASVMKSRRQAAISDILAIQQGLEKHRTNNLTYPATLANNAAVTTLAAPWQGVGLSDTGSTYYVFSTVGAGTTYTITALGTGSTQVGDTGCSTLTLDQAGAKTPVACWSK